MVCKSFSGGEHPEEDETFCTRPAWTQRAQRLNESLFQVFEDPQAPFAAFNRKSSDCDATADCCCSSHAQASRTAPLADFLSSQLLEKGRVRVLPPWRSDGRCGPQFPVAKKPGECDPYGGGPMQVSGKLQTELSQALLEKAAPLSFSEVRHAVRLPGGVVDRRTSAIAPVADDPRNWKSEAFSKRWCPSQFQCDQCKLRTQFWRRRSTHLTLGTCRSFRCFSGYSRAIIHEPSPSCERCSQRLRQRIVMM